MTVRRASFLGLVGLVFAFWIAVIGCNLDATGFGETEGLCTTAAHCDDGNVCTIDTCGIDGLCAHEPTADGTFADGVQGNCKVFQCSGGAETLVFFPEDVDDGNDCTKDECTQAPGGGAITATHEPLPASTSCNFKGGLGTCDGAGSCTAECGFLGDDGNEVGCPAGPSACTLSFCDKSKGVCVLEELDGIPAPGFPEPGECGGTYCVGGAVSEELAGMGSPCLQTEGPNAGSAGVCSMDGECLSCNNKFDCDDPKPESECHSRECIGGTCVLTDQPDGPLVSQVIGDCHTKICTNGIFINQIDDGDTEDDGNDCTQDICANGTPTHPNEPINTGCGAGDLLYCDGNGVCKGCVLDNQCAGGTDCLVPKCNVGMGECYLQPEPAGKVVTMQSPGDCTNNVCDANGNITTAYYPADPQNDNLDCTVDTCVAMNQTSHTPAAYGTTCNDGGGVVCDAAAHCVGKPCSVPADCAAGTFCVDGFCCDATCGGGCQACSAAKKGGGDNGLCGVIGTGDPDSECPGNSGCNNGVCQPLANGSACVNVAGECSSGFCTDGFCCNSLCDGTCVRCNSPAGTCTAIANGQDPSNECANGACDGTGACRKDNGQPCAAGGECLSAICTDLVCCNAACGGTCQACNLAGSMGACTSVPNNQDPSNECANGACNGGGQCKLDTGQPCATGGDCLTGFCADGFCCNAACGSTCQACSAAKTGGANGTCGNVTAATDPDSDCVGVTNCNGAGACTKLSNGSACTINGVNGECSSGNCVDGVCCNTACGATCNACNLAGSVGTCTAIPAGQDPSNECTLNGGNDVCNGAGLCKEVNGTPCAGATECLSGHCQDSVCCDNTCTGTCQSCNLGGSAGTCTNIPNGSDPANECTGVTNCNGAGACTKLPIGATCTLGGECASTFCADGVCCDAACSGTCQSCNLAGSVGACTPIPSGQDPANECTLNGGNDVCNGAGACKEINGTSCSAASECLSGFCVEGVCCSAACTNDCQSCLAANTASPNGTCDLVDVNTDPQGDCMGAQVCNIMGMCVGGPLGAMCGDGAECGSTFCADGLCCSSACGATCFACDLAGSPGTCTAVPTNTDPDNECAASEVCNGSGACKKIDGDGCAANSECLSGNCVDSVCCNTTCTGTCQACSTFKKGGGTNGVCGNINKPADPDPDNECAGAQICSGGACIPAPNGTGCTVDGPDANCASGNCVDNVCCNTTCTGFCQACSTFKKGMGSMNNGTCENILTGNDPDDECDGGTPNCDGTGMCGP